MQIGFIGLGTMGGPMALNAQSAGHPMLVNDLRRAILDEGMRRVETFASRYRLAELAWPGSAAPFLNVNTPAGVTMTGGGAEAITLAKSVSQAWVTFAKTGRPAAPGLPDWPASGGIDRAAMHINIASHVAPYMDPNMATIYRAKLWKAAGLS